MPLAWLEVQHPSRPDKEPLRLRKVVTTLGRAPGNDVVLDDAAVAASHASIVRQGTAWSITAVERTATLKIGGESVHKATLRPGMTLTMGSYKLTFHEGEPATPPGDEIPLGMLERLVALSSDMMRDTAPERLFTTLLHGLVELTGAEKGFIILFKDGERLLVASHNVATDPIDLSRISDSIVDRVVDTGRPVIVSDALHDTRFGKAQSVVDLRLSSVMCVPMRWQEDLLGVVYLGNDAVQGLFTERDLSVLEVYATMASLVVWHALLLNRLRLDNEVLRRQLERAEYGEMVGASPPMREVYRVVGRVAPTVLSVLILGETGTGKELVARAIHARSPRKSGPFVAINCGAIPEHLLESELFGHKKGAFTGADADKMGRIEAAHGGTLFLDEIGEMPMPLQVKLLRVLQEHTIERVGDVVARKVDLRVVAATNRDPELMTHEGTFREDLYYRLNEVCIKLPPLRERGEDISILARFFLERHREQYGGKARGFTNQALAALKSAAWPGNVRQLENRIKKAVILSDRALLNPEDLDLAETERAPLQSLAAAQEHFKSEYIRMALERNQGNKAQTARDLDVDARTIFRYLEKQEDAS